MAKLILTSGEQRQEFELAPINTIGRHPDNSIQILDRIISKEHAQILRGGDGHYLLRDLGSLNGTYVSGSRVSEVVLKHGDELVLGSTHLMFVEHTETEESLNRVTIAPSSLESIVRHKVDVAQSARDFLPEKQLFDVEHLRRDYEKLRIAHELGRAIVGVLDLEQLLPRILDKAFDLLPADRGVILLYDQDGKLTPRYVKHKTGRDDDQIVISKSIIAEVEQQKKAVLSSDATMDSRFSGAHSIIMQGIRSTMCVPLIHGDELLGIMHMDSQIATNAFTEKDLQLFTGIAAQAAVAIQNARLAKKIETETKTRAQFQRLLSPNLVEQLVAGKLHLEKGGELREVTILISDIRGFTSMSEKKEPAEIVQMLNEYFELMVDILFRAQGTLDKYVGDEIMALFGAPVDMPDAPLNAVRCAVDMQKALREFNRTRIAEGQEPIKIGIGINTGRVITGAIGSSRTLQYTAIGDAVNTASRLCSIAKQGEIILSESTMRRVAEHVDSVTMAPVRLKGKENEQQVYNVVGMKGDEWRQERTRPM
ncbi:MAG TPA: adenylate/guanylate cyclase domain-containing protein [Polyangia bacterium]|nr:adenylate/guanylate cyclase domain-containing protein [Polyangia bacterium]